MVFENPAEQVDDLRAEVDHQHREYEETDEASGEDCDQEIAEAHLEDRGTEHEDFEWHRGRQHSWKHQSPEFVLLEGSVNFEKPFFGDAFAQHSFSACVPDQIQRDAAQRRSQSRDDYVEEHPAAILIDVRCDHKIDGHADQSAVGKGDHEHTPDPEYLHQAENPYGVLLQDLLNGFQGNS